MLPVGVAGLAGGSFRPADGRQTTPWHPLAHARSPRDKCGTRSAMEGIVSSANLERIPVLGLQPS